MSRRRVLPASSQQVLVLVALAVTLAASQAPALAQHEERWLGAWATSPVAPLTPSTTLPWGPPPKREFENQTLRQFVHISLGGNRVRIRLSNQYGTEPLQVAKTYVALRRSGSSILPESNRPVTYGGQPAVRIPPGAAAWSDPVALEQPAALTSLKARPTAIASLMRAKR